MSRVVFLETVRRHVTNVAYLVVLLVFALVASLVGGVGGPQAMWVTIANLAGIVIACQLIGPEFSSGTLQLVLAKPVNRAAYLLSRYLGVVVAIAILFVVPALFDAGARILVNHDHMTWSMFALPVNTAASFIIAAALFALFGSMSRSYINVALYVITQAVLYGCVGVLQSIERGDYAVSPWLRDHSGVRTSITRIAENLFPRVVQSFDWRWIVMLASNAALTLLLACMIFRQREVPYGAD